jgi:hypothetical protein
MDGIPDIPEQEVAEFREIFNLVDRVRMPACTRRSPVQCTSSPSARALARSFLCFVSAGLVQDGGGSIDVKELEQLMDLVGVNASEASVSPPARLAYAHPVGVTAALCSVGRSPSHG